VVVVLAFALLVLGCSSPQERAGGAGGEDAARPAHEAKQSGKGADIPPVPADGDYNCADFQTRAQAKDRGGDHFAVPLGASRSGRLRFTGRSAA
jgi:hypothetical protein